MFKGYVVLWVGYSHGMSAPCFLWCPGVLKWRYVFKLSRKFVTSSHLRAMRNYGWELSTLASLVNLT